MVRVAAKGKRPRKAVRATFPAPTGGWISNRNLAIGRDPRLPPGAEVLDNFFPTATGVKLRRGSVLRYNIGSGPIASMFRYNAGAIERLFASISGPIYDISGSTATELRTGGTNGAWQTQQITTVGGTFMVGVNGADEAWVYNGTQFSASTITFPGTSSLTTAALSHVFLYSQRLFFIQRDSMDVWYLPVDQMGGELTRLPLGGVFTLGGSLVFGQGWSLSNGGEGGLSDQCIFVSTEGEVVAYQGINPSDANAWRKVGLYRIGRPLGKDCFFRAGGDVMVATSVGFVGISQAVKNDYAALGAQSLSHPIEEAWNGALADRGMGDWRCIMWPEGRAIFVSPPPGQDVPYCFVANSITGAWSRYTGWDIRSIETYQGNLHFGDSAGNVWLGSVTGSDNGETYTGACLPLYEDMGDASLLKVFRNARATARALSQARVKLTGMANFSRTLPNPPGPLPQDVTSVWGSAIWGQSLWGNSGATDILASWVSIGGSGHDMSVALQVSSNDIRPLDLELIRLEATYEAGGLMS